MLAGAAAARLVLAARLRVDPANYGGETGMKPDGVVAVTLGSRHLSPAPAEVSLS